MSVSLHVLLLDLAKFKAIQGSGDHRLLRKILREKKEDSADQDEFLSSDDLTVAEAIGHVIDGKIDPKARPLFQYEHAAAVIADTIGEVLDSGPLEAGRTDFWDEVDQVIRTRLRKVRAPKSAWPGLSELLDRGPLLKIPVDRENPLGTGFLTAREVVRALRISETFDLESREGLGKLRWPQEALEGACFYRGWLKFAGRRGLGLFFHC